ncbi:Type I secretion membrane fusion protein, HlyD [Candidatus Liberibacter solanacearum CLso-ZC1]|uniref:Type I secretion membrane fusion protein, HlyD n=1 Tax=Liberibacter solanacearum (strain CLso-ZC1) TaxID=658172 RepID=E4UCW2_LIBSC|nr:HlyD family efflux transporter periplasmic adaptor subunit [Candidatus Liberibacter solanacearum]ADR52202.1 Type I secretion membrane fusion protein, HlyD [Candidatus Liberibacter solanacearum CLso-ZC1]
MYNIFWKNFKKHHLTTLAKTIILSTIGIVGLIIWSILLPIEIRVSSLGEILYDNDIVEIKSPFSGIINKFQVNNGAQVLQGDPLLTFEDTETNDLLNLKKSSITDLKCRIDTANSALNFLNSKYDVIKRAFDIRDEQLLDFLRNYPPTCSKVFNYEISKLYRSLKLKLTRTHNLYSNYLDLEDKISLSNMLLLSHKKDLTITKNLFKDNVVSKNELNQQERVVHKSALELTTDLNAQKAMLRHINELYDEANVEFANYLKDISRDLDHNQRTLIDEISKATILEKKISQHTILSPIMGTIVYNQSFSSSNYIQESQLLMKIVPRCDLTHIRAKVAPQQIQSVKNGQIATVRFPHYPDIREKKFKAIIETINPIISQRNNDSSQTQNYYEVILKIIDPAYFDNKIELRNGYLAEILFTAEYTTLAKEIIRPITNNWPKIFER